MRWPFWILLIYQIIGEGVRLSQGKLENLSLFAVVDSVSLGINTFIFLSITLKLKLVSLVWLRTLGCYGIMLIYSKTFYWLRMWPTYALSVRVIKDVTYDMKEFLVLLFGVVALFGNAVYILDLGRRGEQNEIFSGIGDNNNKWLGSLINQWLVGLGQFDSVEVFYGENVYTVWTIFVLATLFTNVIFINMLVAIMSRTFNKTITNTHVSLKEQIEILSDWSWVVNLGWRFRTVEKVSYMFSVVPVDEADSADVQDKVEDVI